MGWGKEGAEHVEVSFNGDLESFQGEVVSGLTEILKYMGDSGTYKSPETRLSI